jgi:antitoxin (DNA-binding transcriptional repressor) of toxin-antitoxin stability system
MPDTQKATAGARDAKADVLAILDDVARGHTKLDRGHAAKLVAAIKAGSVSVAGTY